EIPHTDIQGMRSVSAPSDYIALAKQAKKLDTSACAHRIRVAVLGDCATRHLTAILPVLFSRASIDVRLFEAEYDSIELQVFDPASDLYAFAPDAIVLLNSSGKLRKQYYSFGEDKSAFPADVVRKITAVWDAIGAQTRATVIQSTFVVPIERLYGNFDNRVDGSLYVCAQRINAELTREAHSRPALLI